MSSRTYSLGRVSLIHRGAWDESATYERLDVVSYDGASYIVLSDVTGVEPPDTSYYGVLAERGMSTYEVWLAAGNTGTESEFFESLSGAGVTELETRLSALETWQSSLTDSTEVSY